MCQGEEQNKFYFFLSTCVIVQAYNLLSFAYAMYPTLAPYTEGNHDKTMQSDFLKFYLSYFIFPSPLTSLLLELLLLYLYIAYYHLYRKGKPIKFILPLFLILIENRYWLEIKILYECNLFFYFHSYFICLLLAGF